MTFTATSPSESPSTSSRMLDGENDRSMIVGVASSSLMVMVAGFTAVISVTVSVPEITIVWSSSSTTSATGVIVTVLVADVLLAGMVIVPRVVSDDVYSPSPGLPAVLVES